MEKVGERNEVGITPLPPDYTTSGADKQNSSAKCDNRLKLLKLVH